MPELCVEHCGMERTEWNDIARQLDFCYIFFSKIKFKASKTLLKKMTLNIP
jgi:hypothetical protein